MATKHDSKREKVARQQGREANGAADAAFDAGDYKTALRLYLEAVHAGPDTQIGHQAMLRAQMLRIDPVAVYAGLGTMALLAIACAYAWSP